MRVLLICGLLATTDAFGDPPMVPAPVPAQTSAARQQALVRIVRQDCGACHGMRLTGGLGPPLTPEALADRPLEVLVASIVSGRSGTPMPAWKTLLSGADAEWIARRLLTGFPREPEPPQ